MDEKTAEQAVETKPERGFCEGEHVVLRPVREADLPELARLLAENPYEREPLPWTHQRLKQKFEDKEKPGLWEDEKRIFAIARKSGGLVGFVRENQDWSPTICWNAMHVDQAAPDRDVLGLDALKAYLKYKRKWHNPQRLSYSILRPETAKAEWLKLAGFELELTMERVMLYRGVPEAECVYTWISPEALANCADDGPVAGENQ